MGIDDIPDVVDDMNIAKAKFVVRMANQICAEYGQADDPSCALGIATGILAHVIRTYVKPKFVESLVDEVLRDVITSYPIFTREGVLQ